MKRARNWTYGEHVLGLRQADEVMCWACGERPASGGGHCDICGHGIGPGVCRHCHSIGHKMAKVPSKAEMERRARSGRGEGFLLKHPNPRRGT